MSKASQKAFENFDWSSLEGWDENQREEIQKLATELARQETGRFLVKLGEWIFSEGKARSEGILIRSHVAFWSVVGCLANLNQVKLAELLELKAKKSINRHVISFRDTFGWVGPHMQTETARRSCWIRRQKQSEGNGSH